MKGIVDEPKIAEGQSEPYGFNIKGEDGEMYYAHLGDLKESETLLYNNRDKIDLLKKDDEVEFQPIKHQEEHNTIHAVSVKKI